MPSIKDYIINLLNTNKLKTSENYYQAPTADVLKKSPYYKAIVEVYKELGGIHAEPPLQIMPYDIQLESGIIMIEEDTFYNRYRAITLRSSLYDHLSNINVETHKRYCRQYESECLKSASNIKQWSNSESEKYFGQSQDIGDLSSPGPSLWKMKAFQNFVTDVSSLINKTTVFRLSPYDNLVINGKMIKVKEFLLYRNPTNEVYLLKYIQRALGISQQ